MIRLHPIPDVDHTCPYCQVRLEVKGWYIPGMRNLADLKCLHCGREFYGDLPAGHGLYYPMLLEPDTGKVHDPHGVPWFADWLRRSYAKRSNRQMPFSVEERKPIKRAVLLNCLDTLYGHCLLKLLNAQYYLDHKSGMDLIVLVPRFLRWLVPEGVAAIWTVDLPLYRGIEWNDWLADKLHKRIAVLDDCWLSVAFSHPHPEDFNIERFTHIIPFPIDKWEERLDQRPTVTFIWREDRLWKIEQLSLLQRVRPRLAHSGIKLSGENAYVKRQNRYMVKLAENLRLAFPKLDFAVVGIGKIGHFPDWITDLRRMTLDESTERAWCERYACSHIVIGIHGSSMLLPSAHAGAVVELIPPKHWGNLLQDLLFHPDDLRETMFRCRILPIATSVRDVALTVISLLRDHRSLLVNMRREFCDHARSGQVSRWVVARQQHLPRLPSTTSHGKEGRAER